MATNLDTAVVHDKHDDDSHENNGILPPSYATCRSILFLLTAFYMIFYVGGTYVSGIRNDVDATLYLFVYECNTHAFYFFSPYIAFFGFGPMQLMLEENGAFSILCKKSNTTTIPISNNTVLLHNSSTTNNMDSVPMTTKSHHLVCPTQSRTLQYVSFIATILAQLATPVFGDISDRYGPLILHILLSVLGCVGVAVILISSWTQIYDLLYVAFILIGFMAMASAPIIMEVAYLYSLPSSRRRVISSLNCLWDVGGGVGYWILWIIAHSSHLSFLLVIGLYLIVGCIIFTTSTFLWKVIVATSKVNRSFHKSQTLSCEENSTPTDESTNTMNILHSTPSIDDDKVKHYIENDNNDNTQPMINALEENDVESTTIRNTEQAMVTQSITKNKTSFWKHVTSSRFILLTFIFSVHVSRILFTLTSARDFLKHLGDDVTGNRYLTILSLLSPVAILGLPVVDFFVERWGYIVSLQLINAIAIVHGIILVGSTNLDLQILGFVLLALYRCLTFAIILSYLEVISEKHVLGKLTGIICLIPGLFQLINLPMSDWALGSLHGNFFWPNLIYTLFVLPCIVGVCYLGYLQKMMLHG